MPLSEEQRQNMKKRRQKILNTAVYLFATEGYEGTTIKKIAEAADVSFGNVFTYFKDKEQLFYAAVVEPLEAISDQILDFNENAEDPLLELQEMVKKDIQLFAGEQNYLTLVVQVVGQYQRFPEPFDQLNQFHDHWREKVGRLIENGQHKGLLKKQASMPVATLYTSLLIGIRLNNTDTRYSDMWAQYITPAFQLFGPIHE
ncbi:transcriptional regulator, TetR family [Oceanobacillus limi]|uniref:Transcriptional regulator, TetR family n=1 Tax=Oceanobacillus limi TaxID=930131 RepID=A0A1I0G4Q3_9BACI|nr:TetR/AcrR family transcriptional regulator [Oceanobacillus limi]SET65002.1 transcriptional regulator, TetR family [Oceanobacillus limi]